jgi:hypothetical protein
MTLTVLKIPSAVSFSHGLAMIGPSLAAVGSVFLRIFPVSLTPNSTSARLAHDATISVSVYGELIQRLRLATRFTGGGIIGLHRRLTPGGVFMGRRCTNNVGPSCVDYITYQIGSPMTEDVFIHEIEVLARHRAHDGTETVERVYGEAILDKADPLVAANRVLDAAVRAMPGQLRKIDISK